MGRAHRKAKLACDDNGNRRRHGDAEGTHAVEFRDLGSDSAYELGAVQYQTESNSERPHQQHPARDRRLCRDTTLKHGFIDRGQRAHRIRNIIRPMRETQKRSRKN